MKRLIFILCILACVFFMQGAVLGDDNDSGDDSQGDNGSGIVMPGAAVLPPSEDPEQPQSNDYNSLCAQYGESRVCKFY